MDRSEKIVLRQCLERDITMNMYNDVVSYSHQDLISIIDELWCFDNPQDFKLKGYYAFNYAEEPHIMIDKCKGLGCKT